MPDPELFTGCAIWAPSGKGLACEGNSEVDPTRNGVYTVRASDGKDLTRMTSNPGGIDSPLSYSPDGTQLLLARTKAAGAASSIGSVTAIRAPAANAPNWNAGKTFMKWSTLGTPMPPGWQILAIVVAAPVVFFLGLLVFQKNEREFADYI